MFLFRSPQFYYFPSSFLNSLPLQNINLSPPPPHSFFYRPSFTIFLIFPPQSWFPFSSTILIFSLLHLHLPLPNHMYFKTDFKVFKMYFQYLNTIFLYFNPIWQKNLNFRPCLKYILSVVKLHFIKRKTSLINLQCILFHKYD